MNDSTFTSFTVRIPGDAVKDKLIQKIQTLSTGYTEDFLWQFSRKQLVLFLGRLIERIKRKDEN